MLNPQPYLISLPITFYSSLSGLLGYAYRREEHVVLLGNCCDPSVIREQQSKELWLETIIIVQTSLPAKGVRDCNVFVTALNG
ncbi:hypothetical protein MTR_1g104990 [Medicago truncatula]|uniref:Uncharacterized protein n=1 Tax=Medicago truncatula TaxID=3880 RepID=G7IE25_MEDTR|nr:hypothetical protein MTR_1g104990 [Medicago truncatula]